VGLERFLDVFKLIPKGDLKFPVVIWLSSPLWVDVNVLISSKTGGGKGSLSTICFSQSSGLFD